MRDMLEARKRGDLAFRDKDFKTAIDCYSQVPFRFLVFQLPQNHICLLLVGCLVGC